MKPILYTIGCPKCIVLEKNLAAAAVDFEICNDVEKIKEKGIVHLPALEVNGEIMDFVTSVKWVGESRNGD